MNIRRIALFAFGWFVLRAALTFAFDYYFFSYRGDELRSDPAMVRAVAGYLLIWGTLLTVATLVVYVLVLRGLQTRLTLHALALFVSLEIIGYVYTAAFTGQFALDISDWLPPGIMKLVIAFLAVGGVSGVRRVRAWRAQRQPRAESPEAPGQP